jgi:RNA polymerase sigma-70 factor, ECF subfamily
LTLPIAADAGNACAPSESHAGGQSRFAPGTNDRGGAVSICSADNAEMDQSPMDSLEDAFARWQDELLGTLYYLVGNREDARDALQETFVKCWRSRESLAEVENLKAWIFRVALNTGRDLRSSAWRRRREPLAEGGAMVTAVERSAQCDMEHAEEIERVRTALLDLRPEEQEVFLLRQNGELTYEAIGEAIGIPLGTVKTRMRLAIGKLRVALAG